jgi:K+-transporting ATPase KdpF subunit
MRAIFISLLVAAKPSESSATGTGYLIGGIVAMILLAYLIYVLLRPEKF